VCAEDEIPSKKLTTAQIANLMLQHRRCIVCGMPLPGKPDQDICSRRCSTQKKKALQLQTTKLQEIESEILSIVTQLRDDATICPGTLAQKIFPDSEDPLRLLRPIIFYLQEQRRLRLSQKGAVLPWWKIRGPFRVGKVK
jgi:predicted nucleic acid-binding Zn ribbon protein